MSMRGYYVGRPQLGMLWNNRDLVEGYGTGDR
jgi:hypothetical protein